MLFPDQLEKQVLRQADPAVPLLAVAVLVDELEGHGRVLGPLQSLLVDLVQDGCLTVKDALWLVLFSIRNLPSS
jgi:hypothetical protein